eukprot:TRINITY_DN65614_c0_g1_i3.p1 TRINITY_DN65614_c0_g1~~TRINITY_DN65614_c0_g1_i3.p1  ORF type:complete len:346 (-),score=48.89 TRINITY_DN65614_c0_g1_i3:339-1376(-)
MVEVAAEPIALFLLIASASCLLLRTAWLRRHVCLRAGLSKEEADGYEVFYSARSKESDGPGPQSLAEPLMLQAEPQHVRPLPASAAGCWTEHERKAWRAFCNELEKAGDGTPLPSDSLALQAIWARQLDASAAARLWRQHLEMCRRIGVKDVDDARVRQAYAQGFCVRSGCDVDGRPMIWVRMALCDASPLSPAVVVRNTWLAQDATLAGEPELCRKGICFVYDLSGVSLGQMSKAMRAGWANPKWQYQALFGGPSHPAHISRVWLLDAPAVFLGAWRALNHFLPAYLLEVVQFVSSSDGLDQICLPQERPVYLRGDDSRFAEPYVEWMFRRLVGLRLAYRHDGA